MNHPALFDQAAINGDQFTLPGAKEPEKL